MILPFRKLMSANGLLIASLLLVLLFSVGGVFAQQGEYNPNDDDGRLNDRVHLGGANVYCVDRLKRPSDTYANGGGILVLDAEGEELLFVSEREIARGFETMRATGAYVTLGTSERLWFGARPIALYLLTSGEFQVNAADEYDKPVENQ
jgi:hypothetical protein